MKEVNLAFIVEDYFVHEIIYNRFGPDVFLKVDSVRSAGIKDQIKDELNDSSI